VVVLGAGPIGLLVLQAARAAGAGTVVLVEPQRSRRELGGSLGADKLIDPVTDDVAQALNAHIGAQGADVVIECAGIPRTIEQVISLVRRGGTISLVGVPNHPAQIQAAEWLVKEVRLATSLAYLREEFDIAQGLVADGRLRCTALHTSTVSLQQLGDAFTRLSQPPQETDKPPHEIKVLVDPRL